MAHKVTIGVRDKRLGKGEQTIPLVGTGNPSDEMVQYANKEGSEGGTPPKKVPRAVVERAIINELDKRSRQNSRE